MRSYVVVFFIVLCACCCSVFALDIVPTRWAVSSSSFEWSALPSDNLSNCSVSFSAENLFFLPSEVFLGAVIDSVVVSGNVSDAESSISRSVVAVSSLSCDEGVFVSSKEVLLSHNVSVVASLLNFTANDSYTVGDYLRLEVEVFRNGVAVDVSASSELVVSLYAGEEVVDSFVLTDVQRTDVGKFFFKTAVTDELVGVTTVSASLVSVNRSVQASRVMSLQVKESSRVVSLQGRKVSSSFSAHESPFSVDDLVVENTKGRIDWSGTALDISSLDNLSLDDVVTIDEGFVFVNSSRVPSLNASSYAGENFSARIVLSGVDCSYGDLYYGHANSRDEIIGGELCSADMCRDVSCVDGELSFVVAHFSSYAYGSLADLGVWDSSDNQTVKVNESFSFFANFTNSSDGVAISDAVCNWSQNSSGSWSSPFSMVYNVSTLLYEVNDSFESEGNFSFNVSCFHDDFDNLSLLDDFLVTPPNRAPTGVTLSPSSVLENASVSTLIGSLSALDPDVGDAHSFSLVDNGSFFSLSGENVSLGKVIDFELNASVNITVNVSDSEGLWVLVNVTISVLDVAEVPSVSVSSFNGGSSDIIVLPDGNTTLWGVVSLSDGDGFANVSVVEGVFYRLGVGLSASDNLSNHYTSSCSFIQNSSLFSAVFNCSFSVVSFIEPTDAGSALSADEWVFSVSVNDSVFVEGDNVTGFEVLSLVALSLPSAFSLSFAGLSRGENSSTSAVSVSNVGNSVFSLNVSATNMTCGAGIIENDFLRSDNVSFSYTAGEGLNLSISRLFSSFALPNVSENVYFALGIPSSVLDGNCVGLVSIIAES